MKCKPGDLAIIVGGLYNVGKAVQCIELVGEYYKQHFVGDRWRPLWVIDKEIIWKDIHDGTELKLPLCPDQDLMPIRPDEMKDEELENTDESIHV